MILQPPFQDFPSRWHYQATKHINTADIQLDLTDDELKDFLDNLSSNCQQLYLNHLSDGFQFNDAFDKVMETYMCFEGDKYLELIYQNVITHFKDLADSYSYPSIEFSVFIKAIKRGLEETFGLETVRNNTISESQVLSFVLEYLLNHSYNEIQ